MSIKPADELSFQYKGKWWCYYQDELWIWNDQIMVWEAQEVWPPEFEIIDGELVLDGCVIAFEDKPHKCHCEWAVVLNRGCQCGGV